MTNGKLFIACIAASFSLWTIWCLLIVYCGTPFSLPMVRAVVRIGVVAIPAIVYLCRGQKNDDKSWGFNKHIKLGISVGIAVSLLHLVMLTSTRSFSNYSLPTDLAVWLNFILFSPFAEELLFRRVAVSYLTDRFNRITGIVFSAFLFSLFHLPWWLISGEKTEMEMLTTCSDLFLYGIIFAILYQSTKSLWASLIPHWVNNLALLGLSAN